MFPFSPENKPKIFQKDKYTYKFEIKGNEKLKKKNRNKRWKATPGRTVGSLSLIIKTDARVQEAKGGEIVRVVRIGKYELGRDSTSVLPSPNSARL